MSALVLVRRLLRLYDPWEALHIDRRAFFGAVQRAKPIDRYVPHGYRFDYDAGRVRYLLDRMRVGLALDPIEVDNVFSYGSFASIALVDGHHRLMAAHYAKAPTLPAEVGGWVDMAEWLCGSRRRLPVWGAS